MNVSQIKSLIKKGVPGRYAAGNGLYFRVTNEGAGVWVVRYSIHKKRREITIGQYPDLSLADAGSETLAIKKNLKKGVDPLAERKRADKTPYKTVDDLAEDWLKDCDSRLKHPQIPRRVYYKDISPTIGGLALTQVNPRDIRATIANITKDGRPTIANDALMYAKQLFRHGIKLDLLNNNPAEPFTVDDAGGVEKSRSRALSLEDVEIVFKCFRKYSDQFTRENYLASALLVALGIRKGELIGAKWEEFDTKNRLWHIPPKRIKTKTDQIFTVPLPLEVVNWLGELYIRANGSEYVFPKRRASKRNEHVSPDTLNAAIQKLFREKKLAIEHFTVHDLRRTCRSFLSAEGVPGHVAERCLNHKLKGVEGIYDRYDYLNERREALEKVARLVSPLIDQKRHALEFS